ncbi:hypothetical protein GUITHDRAFT_149834 [Guillardia theta CCMP2712]|uniref:TGS domain-containing protein n=1 Tax=Guillardia theta (strain CCMP2712) TaxID=905079 RepID=L1K1I9_GUITC|nr:hypothetical protein GUITHDRAFT_149834 [Guillardia theta CCMP2712]EKX54711.1 hypothetical protein GUITHDRAFT_149834 [Guillardia theta CCMP2712]|eukprot:XP_005841691.1 hypothetical protein GUITHDRAFT_149834 [Guillardia theta CCMP2712]
MARRMLIVAGCLLACADAFISPSPMAPACRPQQHACRLRSQRSAIRMGLFDGVAKAFQNALANEDLPPAGPDGLSQDPWMKGVRKAITIYFVKDGEVVAQGDALPGDLLNTIASKAGVSLRDTVMMKTDQADLQVQSKTARIPAPGRRNMISDEALRDGDEMLETGLSAPVWTNYASRGEVRTVKEKKVEYWVYLS